MSQSTSWGYNKGGKSRCFHNLQAGAIQRGKKQGASQTLTSKGNDHEHKEDYHDAGLWWGATEHNHQER